MSPSAATRSKRSQSDSSGDSRIPREFAYWDNIRKPKFQRQRKLLRLLFRADPQLPDDIVERYGQCYYDADPVAEAFVEAVYMKQGQAVGRAMVDCALAQGVDAVENAPASLKRLFAEIETDPDWVDKELVELGARVFRRYGTHMYSFAGAITLQGYQEASVAKPLAFTGTYGGETANRRFLETAAFWVDVSEPGGLEAGGRGRATALRVRLMHVFVRKRLLQHPKWDLDAWGMPISQGDALLTLMGGSFVPGVLLNLMGYRTTRHEIEAMMHFWRYVGHLMGVQPRWYPANFNEALGLMFASQVKGVGRAGDDGKFLCQSYVDSYAPDAEVQGFERVRQQLEYFVELGYVGFFLPPSTLRYFDLPQPGVWRWHPLLQAPAIFGFETLRRRIPRVDDWFDKLRRRQTKRWLARNLGERAAEYKAVESFTR